MDYLTYNYGLTPGFIFTAAIVIVLMLGVAGAFYLLQKRSASEWNTSKTLYYLVLPFLVFNLVIFGLYKYRQTDPSYVPPKCKKIIGEYQLNMDLDNRYAVRGVLCFGYRIQTAFIGQKFPRRNVD